jgi:hypothetical protein
VECVRCDWVIWFTANELTGCHESGSYCNSARRAFDPFDRLAQRTESEGKSLSQLLDEFDSFRRANLDELRELNLTPVDLGRRGRHPALGGVTLSQLVATWAAHNLTYLHHLPNHGLAVSGGRGSVGRLSGCAAIRRSQLQTIESDRNPPGIQPRSGDGDCDILHTVVRT